MDEPPLLSPQPPPRDSGGTIALRALAGFFAYVIVGALTLRSRGSAILMVLLLVAALVMAIKGKIRGFALGVFIGLGLTLLLAGACFVMLSRMKF